MIRGMAALALALALTGTHRADAQDSRALGTYDQRPPEWRSASRQVPVDMERLPSLDLAQAVMRAVARHPDVARALADLAKSGADKSGASSAWMPRLSYEGTVDPSDPSISSRSGLDATMTGSGVTLHQLLWDFGRTGGEVATMSAVERQRRYELEGVLDEVAETAALAFLEVNRYERLEGETMRHVESLRHVRELIRLRSDAGISDASDLLLADVRVEGAGADEIQARTALRAATLRLANLTGVLTERYVDPEPVIATFPARPGAPDYDELPQIAAAEQAERAALARIDQVKASRWPRIGIQVAYNDNYYTRELDDDPLTALLTVTGDLYRGDISHSIQAALEERRAARAAKASAVLDLRGRILAAREEIAGGEARIAAYRRQEQQAIATSEIFLEEYKIGQRSLSDLLNAELEIYRAARARVSAEYDVRRARLQFETVHGSLLGSLGLAEPGDREGGL